MLLKAWKLEELEEYPKSVVVELVLVLVTGNLTVKR